MEYAGMFHKSSYKFLNHLIYLHNPIRNDFIIIPIL